MHITSAKPESVYATSDCNQRSHGCSSQRTTRVQNSFVHEGSSISSSHIKIELSQIEFYLNYAIISLVEVL